MKTKQLTGLQLEFKKPNIFNFIKWFFALSVISLIVLILIPNIDFDIEFFDPISIPLLNRDLTTSHTILLSAFQLLVLFIQVITFNDLKKSAKKDVSKQYVKQIQKLNYSENDIQIVKTNSHYIFIPPSQKSLDLFPRDITHEIKTIDYLSYESNELNTIKVKLKTPELQDIFTKHISINQIRSSPAISFPFSIVEDITQKTESSLEFKIDSNKDIWKIDFDIEYHFSDNCVITDSKTATISAEDRSSCPWNAYDRKKDILTLFVQICEDINKTTKKFNNVPITI